MTYKIIIKPLAEIDIKETYSWYDARQSGLVDVFLQELERGLERIKINPFKYQIRYKAVRMVKLNRFPVCLHYLVGNFEIFVLAVLSTHRNPTIWSERI